MHPSKNLHPPIHRSYMQIKADGCEHERYENPQIISSAAGHVVFGVNFCEWKANIFGPGEHGYCYCCHWSVC